MTLDSFYDKAEAGAFGDGYVTNRLIYDGDKPVGVQAVFVPMPNGLFRTETSWEDVTIDDTEVRIHTCIGIYLTPEEVEKRQLEEAAFEETRLRKIKEKQVELEINKIAPQLQTLYSILTEEEQAEFASDFDSVSKRLEKGDIKTAKTIISIKQPRTNGGLGVQAAILQVLDELLEKVSKLP